MWNTIVTLASDWAPVLITVAISLASIRAVHYLLKRKHQQRRSSSLGVIGPIITLSLVGAALIATTLVLPISEAARGQLLGLLGLLTTAAVALSSTTYLGNAMAGIMIRAIRHFRPGDSIRVGDHVGRVSAQGILHTEIQTEDRDLTTLPNLYLVTHPVTVLRSSGTVVSATVSLGYEIPHHDVEKYLIEAATKAGLKDPFVHVVDLGDYSILYRAAGFLTEIKHLLTTRSNLRKAMLDSLHLANIEIVSPRFINQRNLAAEEAIVPLEVQSHLPIAESTPEAKIFDKADAAEAKVKIEEELQSGLKRVQELNTQLSDSAFEAEKVEIHHELQTAERRVQALQDCIEEDEKEN